MICYIESTPLEDDANGLDHAVHRAFTLRALAKWLILKVLHSFKTNATGSTLILIQRHCFTATSYCDAAKTYFSTNTAERQLRDSRSEDSFPQATAHTGVLRAVPTVLTPQ